VPRKKASTDKTAETKEEKTADVEIVNKGDFILLDIIGRVKETNELFDVTSEEVAKKEGVYQENIVYKPRLVIVGEGWVVKGLDEALEGLKVGESKVIELPPEKAFGKRDPKAIKVLPLKEFTKQKIKPYVGMRIRVGTSNATVSSVGGGRVRLDFNSPLAGKAVIYEVKVVKKITENEEKVRSLIERRIADVPSDKWGIKFNASEVEITVPEEAYFIDGIQFIKRGIAKDIQKYIGEIGVKFIEVYPVGGKSSS